MRFLLPLCLSLLGVTGAQAQDPAKSKVHKLPEAEASKTISLNPEYLVFGEEVAKKDKPLPLLICLHGGGGTGTNLRKPRGQAMALIRLMKRAKLQAVVVAPQALKSPRKEGAKGGWVPDDLDVLLPHLLKTLPVNPNRVYLTGVSMGGYGTYAWAGTSPDHFAAIAPMVGGLGALGPKDVTKDLEEWGKNLAKLPMRTYYGAKDRVVPADRGEMIMKAIKKAGGTKAKLIVYDDLGHDAARRPHNDPEFLKWLFSHRRPKE